MSKRILKPRPYNDGTLTEAGFNSLITSALRRASMYWKPKTRCIREARVSKGMYRCAICKKIQPGTLPPIKGKKKRITNILADHIIPIVDPVKGKESWDKWIGRCFIEIDGYQALCKKCHDEKTLKEKQISLLHKL